MKLERTIADDLAKLMLAECHCHGTPTEAFISETLLAFAEGQAEAAVLAERQRALNICTNVEPGDGATMRQTIRARIASGK